MSNNDKYTQPFMLPDGSEVKFRAWDKKNKEMLEVISMSWKWIDIEGVSEMIVGSNSDIQRITKYGVKDFELMQFTGLHDKDNNEIYEGDILSWGPKDHASNSKVFFSDGAFKVSNSSSDTWELLIDVLNGAEVIGNIYENKELFTA